MEVWKSDDFEKFLKDVDQISELVQELNSSDVAVQEKAIEKADRFEEEHLRTVINRTAINNKPTHEESLCAESFMKAAEKDAEERRKRRKVKEERANALKERGNKAFVQGDYEAAVRLYTEGLEQLSDVLPLYTNRAQAYIKLERYKEAISDCEWALKCNDKSIKAYVHMGRAHLALKNFTESRQWFEKILHIEPKRQSMVEGPFEHCVRNYLTQVDLEEKKTVRENTAQELVKEGSAEADTVLVILERLSKPNQTNLYYCGGVELLSQAVKDSTTQTLFRLNNGFSVVAGSSGVRRWLNQTCEEPCGEELCVAMLRLWRAVCSANEENQQLLLQCPSTSEQIAELLVSPTLSIQQECLTLLAMCCQTQHGRHLVIENLNLQSLVEALMDCIRSGATSRAAALTILENLAVENKFRTRFREYFLKTLVPAFEQLLRNISASDQDSLPSFISVVGAISMDRVISKEMACSEEFWRSSFAAVACCASCEYRSILYPLLGLMINTASNPHPAFQELAVEGSRSCVVLLRDPDGGIITRAVRMLSSILTKSTAAVQEVVGQGVVQRLLKILKGTGETSSRYSIRALAACTASSQQACKELVKLDKKLATMRKLLNSSDEFVVGNAALCLGHCLQIHGVATSLLSTDCVPLLLHHAGGDAKRDDVQRNAAITLGKLCKAEPRHVTKLRELHGLEILHSCMKLII